MSNIISLDRFRQIQATQCVAKTANLTYTINLFATTLKVNGTLDITPAVLEKCLLSPSFAQEQFPHVHQEVWNLLWEKIKQFSIRAGDDEWPLDLWIAQKIA